MLWASGGGHVPVLHRINPVFGPQAALSSLIIAAALIGLTLSEDFFRGAKRRDYFAYYTNQSNLLVFLYFALAAPALYLSAALHPLIPHIECALTLSILLTHAVYHHLLRPRIKAPHACMIPRGRIAAADSLLQHYVVPLLTALYWFFFSPGKAQLRAADGVIWLLFPLAYLLFVMLRARLRGEIAGTRSAYPYPFLDIGRCGRRRVALFLLAMLTASALAGCVIVRVSRFLPAAPPLEALLFPQDPQKENFFDIFKKNS